MNTHWQALIDLPSPSNSLSSLCEFYIRCNRSTYPQPVLSGEARGLLWQPPCTLLLGKLPLKTKQSLIRLHGKQEWSCNHITASNEVHILEMGSGESHALPTTPTPSFVTASKKSTTTTTSKPWCPFCAGSHAPSLCDSFKDPKQRYELVRQNRHGFNCLGYKKVSLCNS